MWWFTSPKIIFGEDALEQLRAVEGKRVLIVTDSVVTKLGMLEPVMKELRREPRDDRLPKHATTPLTDGPVAGHVPDLNRQLREYYSLRGWDPTTGHPSLERLRALGVEPLSAYLPSMS